MKILFAILLITHGVIHCIGFVKAFNYSNISLISDRISRPAGIFWLAAACCFITAAVLYLLNKQAWLVFVVIAVIISQVLIFSVWKDAKVGTIANIIILVAAVLIYGTVRFESSYKNDVKENLRRSNALKMDLLTEPDLILLPDPVQRYLKYAGVLNKPKLRNMRIVFKGQMREKGKDFFPFTCEQYNFFDEPTRLFFMKAIINGLTVPGYHKYSHATAIMDIRLFGIFPVVKKAGRDMDRAETVTLFNDMCLMAPATLIDKRITWQVIDNRSVKAIFTNNTITISAILYFNDEGQLVDFVSNDRDANHIPFSTPVAHYKNINGANIMTYGEAIWHYPYGKFVYGKFNLEAVEYNVSVLRD